MSEIKHILYEYGVKQIFRLVVVSGAYSGTYDILKPDGWDEIDSIIDINEDYFNVDNFILGDSEKLKFFEYNDKVAFDLIRNVYNEQGGDGQIIFKWLAVKDGVTYELIYDTFELNLNKYSEGFEKSMRKIDIELKKREAQNKFLNREDTTINLFDDKDLDGNPLTPLETFEIGYKKGDRRNSNFYTIGLNQWAIANIGSPIQVPIFYRSDDYELGNNNNELSGSSWAMNTSGFLIIGSSYGPLLTTNITLKDVSIELSNINYRILLGKPSKLFAYIYVGANLVRKVLIKNSEVFSGVTRIYIDNMTVDLGTINVGESIIVGIESNNSSNIHVIVDGTTATMEIHANQASPLVRTEGVRLFNAIDQICKSYTNSQITLESNILNIGGFYYNTSISTGIFLRGLPPVYVAGQKMKTSFKSLFYDSAHPLLALGYDISGDKLIVEDISYFFKDIQAVDLTSKTYREDDYILQNDKDISVNQLLFGSKKYSTKTKGDLKNFNTTLEASTPLITIKSKFDKQTDFIIDEYKIQELIEDNSSSTNENDDDLVLIDMVNSTDYWDEAVFENVYHEPSGGYLKLTCIPTPFDTTFIEAGQLISITEGINAGNYSVLSVDGASIIVNKTSGIVTGINDTPIKYRISSLIKNRTGIAGEGFSNVTNVKDPVTAVNLRHNPKYQLARWFPYFGGAFAKKQGSEVIKITNYKNNEDATVITSSPDLANEYNKLIKVGADELLDDLRNQYNVFFNGKSIEITLTDVGFQEFLDVYNNWRYGQGFNRNLSRGYITLNTPDGKMNVYPFGKGAFSHDNKLNELTIRGKVKGLFVPKPQLLSVTQIDAENVHLTWDYDNLYTNPIITVQCSTDGVLWTNVGTFNNVTSGTVTNAIFSTYMSGTDVYFRIVVNTTEYHNKMSNNIGIKWAYNDTSVALTNMQEGINCGFSYLNLELKGDATFTIDWKLSSYPGGGTLLIQNQNTLENLGTLAIPFGFGDTDTITTTHVVTGSLRLAITMKDTDKTATGQVLNCVSGNVDEFVQCGLICTITNNVNANVKTFELTSSITKKYRNAPY